MVNFNKIKGDVYATVDNICSDRLLILGVFRARVGYHKDNDVWSDVLDCHGLDMRIKLEKSFRLLCMNIYHKHLVLEGETTLW